MTPAEPVKLTGHEFRVLSYLMHHRGRVVSQSELTEHIYAQDFDRDSNTVEVFIARLRRKLGPASIETVRGFGYRIGRELLDPPALLSVAPLAGSAALDDRGSHRRARPGDLVARPASRRQFRVVTHFSLLGLLAVCFLIAGLSLIRRGLAPFEQLRARLAAVRSGSDRRVEGSYPAEVQPLVNDLNALLEDREHRRRAGRWQRPATWRTG